MNQSRARVLGTLSLCVCILACENPPVSEPDAGAAGDAATSDAAIPPECPGDLPTLDAIVPLPVPSVDGEEDHLAWHCALRAIDPIVPPRAIVCSAEDSHGVRESAVVHAELVRHLARSHGLRTLAWEGDDAGLDAVQEFLRTGDETLLEPYLRALSGSLASTHEARDLYIELRRAQEELLEGETFSINGIDVAVRVDVTRARLLAFLEVADPDWAASIESMTPIESQIRSIQQLVDSSALVDMLVSEWETNRADYEGATDAERTELALFDAENLRDGYGFLSYYAQGDFQGGSREYREPGMERNLVRLAERTDGPLLLMAHAGHCSRTSELGGVPVLGARIDAMAELSDRYRVIAQTYASGEQLQRLPSGKFGVVPIFRSSLGPALGEISAEDSFLVSAASDEFDSSAQYYGEYANEYVPAQSFDAIVFLRSVTASSVYP